MRGRPRPRVFVAEWIDPPFVPGHWLPEMIEAAGGEEVLGRARRARYPTTWDAVSAADPELLVIAPCGFDAERTRREAPTVPGACGTPASSSSTATPTTRAPARASPTASASSATCCTRGGRAARVAPPPADSRVAQICDAHAVTVLAVPVSQPAAPAAPTLTGHSVRGTPITARRLGNAGDGPSVLVIGSIHGNERAGIAIVKRLAHESAAARVRLWVVPDLNPDGSRASTRGNAHGVDLNRNFAWRWRPRTAPGTTFYAGPRALSEPETRFARLLITRLRPDITIWFHQSLTAVDSSGGSTTIEARFARRVALPLRRLPAYPGSATTWQAHRFPKATAFVVELPAGPLGALATRAYARAVLALARGG